MIRDNRGTAGVEFALLLPAIVIIVGGLLQFGQIIAVQQATRDIIDGAVRAGVVQVLSATAVQDMVDASLSTLPSLRDYTIDVEDGTSLAVTVTATYIMAFAGLMPEDMLTFQMTTTLHR
jgi:Flp pilus assembly protein TadG